MSRSRMACRRNTAWAAGTAAIVYAVKSGTAGRHDAAGLHHSISAEGFAGLDLRDARRQVGAVSDRESELSTAINKLRLETHLGLSLRITQTANSGT